MIEYWNIQPDANGMNTRIFAIPVLRATCYAAGAVVIVAALMIALMHQLTKIEPR